MRLQKRVINTPCNFTLKLTFCSTVAFWDMSEQILVSGYRVHQNDDLNEVARMLLGWDCFHAVLERAMENPAIPALYNIEIKTYLKISAIHRLNKS